MNYQFSKQVGMLKHKRLLRTVSLMAVGLFMALAIGGVIDSGGMEYGVMGACALPFLRADRTGCMDEFGSDGGGGGPALSEKEFQGKVLGSLSEAKKKQSDIESKIAEIDQEGKKLAEDFAEKTKSFEGYDSQVKDLTLAMKKMTLKIENEKRSAYGNPLDAITQDEELKTIANAMIRGALNRVNSKCKMNDEHRKIFKDIEERAITTDTSPGSTYQDDELIAQVYSLIAQHGVWSMFDVVPASKKTSKLIVDETDPEMNFVGEGIEPAEAGYTGTTVSATVKKILGWLSISNEALEDSEIDLAQFILPKFANATAKRLDYMTIAADGTNDGPNGGFTGIFHAGTQVVAPAGKTTVAATTYDDWLAVMLAVEAQVLSNPNTCWTLNPFNLIRALAVKDGNGRPIFLPSTDAPSLGAFGSILGYSAKLAHTAPSGDGASSKIASFGDPHAMAVLLRRDFQFAVSEEAKFLEDKTCFRARARAASKIRKATGQAVFSTAAG